MTTETGIWMTVATSLITGIVAGVVMHRSDFCLAGMMRDMFLFRRTFMLRILTLMVLVIMLLEETARQAGWIRVFPFPGFGAPGAGTLIGGMLFGVGMVLAGGCVAGTLYRMGSGNVLSAHAFAGLIIGSVAYAEIHPAWKAFSEATVLVRGPVTLSQLTGIRHEFLLLGCSLIMVLLVIRWARAGRLVRPAYAAGYLQPWQAALVLALLTVLSTVIIGVPLGLTTSYAKLGAWIEGVMAPDHAAGLAYFKLTTVNISNSLLGVSYRGGPGPALDGISLIQYPLVFGIIAGGFLSSQLLGEFRPYWKLPPIQYVSALGGGVLMGIAARMTPACNIWHLMGGVPILALQSLMFAAGLIPGAWLGGKLLTRILSFGRT